MRIIETIPMYLERIAISDVAKGRSGLRTTAEIAEYFSMSIPRTREILRRLAHGDLIEDHGRLLGCQGCPQLWGAVVWTTDPDDDPDGGEPLPANDNEVRLAA